jgi:Tfp pilus assembly protein PilO
MSRFILPVFFLLVPLGLFFTYIDPTYSDIKDLQVKASRLDEALTKSRELQALRQQLDSRRNTFLEEDIVKLQKLIPDHIDNIRLLLDMDSLAADHGMQVSGFSFGGTSSATDGESVGATGVAGSGSKPYKSITMSFSVTSSYEDFLVFLRALERSLRIVDVTSISLANSSGEEYTYNLSFETYWLP